MKKPLQVICFVFGALLFGLMGFTAMGELFPPKSQSALHIGVDLSQEGAQQAATLPHEADPVELPAPGEIEVKIVTREREHGAPLRVLIYHTHTYEAYAPDFDGQYKQTERWRTADSQYNMVRLGAELARILTEEYGMTVVHDTTAFEMPNLDSAYQRSLAAIEGYTAKDELFDLYIDLHRDAYVEGRYKENAVKVGDTSVARVMFLVGKGTGTFAGQAFAQLPDWEKNKARAEVMTATINDEAPGVCRPVSTNQSRYNQHVSTGAFLIEIGNNRNTLAEALAAIPYVARAIGETSGGTVFAQHPVEENLTTTTP